MSNAFYTAPCPFCGSNDTTFEQVYIPSYGHISRVICCACFAYGPRVDGKSDSDLKEAIKRWNRGVKEFKAIRSAQLTFGITSNYYLLFPHKCPFCGMKGCFALRKPEGGVCIECLACKSRSNGGFLMKPLTVEQLILRWWGIDINLVGVGADVQENEQC